MGFYHTVTVYMHKMRWTQNLYHMYQQYTDNKISWETTQFEELQSRRSLLQCWTLSGEIFSNEMCVKPCNRVFIPSWLYIFITVYFLANT